MSGFRFHPAAEAELHEAARYYEDRRECLGESFLAEAREQIAEIVEHPGRWPLIARAIRRKVFGNFPYSTIYTFRGD